MKFTKMHGAANDYVYIDARDGHGRDWPALAAAISDRHTGVGSDGIILLLPSDAADLRMRMFNADGSEGEMCGNGIRCLVRYAIEAGAVTPATSPVSVETSAGVRQVTPIWDGGRMVRARVGMGEPRLRPEEIPVRVAPPYSPVERGDTGAIVDYPLQVDGHVFNITCVSMGNPHAVAFLDQAVAEIALHELGPIVEHHPMFPQRVNFEIANIVDSGRIEARVWERGAGLTMACGTGACAIGVAARLRDETNDQVTVGLPGGELGVTWPGHGEVFLEGPIEEVFEGEWPD